MTSVIAATQNAVSGAGTEFTTTGSFVLHVDGFGGPHESATLLRLGPSGGFTPVTTEKGVVRLGLFPNSEPVPFPGTFRVEKTTTEQNASVSYEEM